MSELVEEWLERHDHPLMNNVILNIVFKHVRRKDLKKCRLVCKTWNTLMIPFTRNAFEVTISGINSMEDFMKVFRSNALGIPYAKFQFGSFCTTEGMGQEFLKLCGDTIKSVRFNGCNFAVEDLSELLKSTPKLEIFETPYTVGCRNKIVVKLFPEDEGTKPRLASLKKLTITEYDNVERNAFCPTYVEELITAAENISSLHLADDGPPVEIEDKGIISTTLDALNLIEKLGRESSILELEISYIDRDDYMDYFDLLHKMAKKQNGLKLKSLEYGVEVYPPDSEEEHEDLLQLISRFKDTLQCLNISDSYCTSFAKFPKMSRLTKLSVSLVQDFNSRCANLKAIFPVLKELTLGLFGESHPDLNEFLPESEPCPIMNSLKLESVFFTINGFKQVLTVFPNLTTLHVNIHEKDVWIFQQIWLEMTQLKSLSISGEIPYTYGLQDSCLAGCEAHELERIGIGDVFNEKVMEGMTAHGRRDLILKLRNQHCQFPSIVNLTDLRSLTLNLHLKNDWARNGLTDLTGYLGLYSMKHLKHLTVYNCQFTETCCQILTEDLGLESWHFKTSTDRDNREIIPSE